MGVGKRVRLSRILDPSDGRGLVVAADHGLMLGPIKGVIDLESTLRKVIEGGPDAILVSPGQARRLRHLFAGKGAPAMLVRVDWTNAFRDKTYTLPARGIEFCRVANVKDAVKLGASGVVTYLFVGFDGEDEHASMVEEFAEECRLWDMPLIVEPLPMGPKVTKANYVDMVKKAVRKAVELGADLLKAPYTGDPYSFSEVVKDASGVPVLVLGGYRAKSLRDSLEVISEILEAGASGIVFGRNVVQHPNPSEAVRLMRAIIHEGKTVADIVKSRLKPPLRLRVNPGSCTGCLICLSACSFAHEGVFQPAKARLRIDYDEEKHSYRPYVCTLCGSCVKACPTGALTIDPETGGLRLTAELCDGCGACVEACPVKVVKLSDGKPLICDLCGGLPECVDWCPTGAIYLEGVGQG
ncbi:MAG: Fructose-bisphosphate aldolase [Candidatus Bathyarchaeota archaeon B24]|nr:MAG: Fructose-bisphosphate aldolase [Candidatus Bathyarchaeota archaeon B24]